MSRSPAPPKSGASRRRFLQRASAAAGSGALGFPVVARAQGPIAMRLQTRWSPDDPFHDEARAIARRVSDMAGGDLRIQVLPADGAVPDASLLDAVAKGAVDGAHGVLNSHYARHPAFGLWGHGPAFGMDANLLLAWHRHGGGAELLKKVYAAIGIVDVVSLLYGPMPTQPLGWFRKRIASVGDLKGLKVRAVGMAAELYEALGAKVEPLGRAAIVPALGEGRIDGAVAGNPTSARAIGLPAAAGVCMLQGYHQSAEHFEMLFNKAKFHALPPKLRAILENAVEAQSAAFSWKSADQHSRDYVALRKEGIRAYRTSDPLLRRQLAAYEAVAGKHRSNPLFQEVERSQRAFAERAVRWAIDTQVDPYMAYRYFFMGSASSRKR